MTDALRSQTAPSSEESQSAPTGSRVLRLSRIRSHVDKRVNLIAAQMLMFRLDDGTADTPVYAVVPACHVTPENEAIVSAQYGEILEIKGGRE